MIWAWTLLLIVSFGMLYYGAELSLDASEIIGKKLGLSPLLIGMLLIGFGTSLPEGFVGHIASYEGFGSVALGSLVGSNIANMFLILGISSLFTQLLILQKGLREQLVIHLLLGGVLWFVLKSERLTLISALPLLLIIVIYMYFIYQEVINNPPEDDEDEDEGPDKKSTGVIFLKMLFGFGLLFVGGELLVDNAIRVCQAFGIEEYVISAILVAFGTSFPELITSLMAAVKGKDSNLIIGNIVGSNLFNCALILGSLGIYNFEITKDLSYEVIALSIGAGFLVTLNLLKINFNKLSGFLFLGSYLFIVLHWLKVF